MTRKTNPDAEKANANLRKKSIAADGPLSDAVLRLRIVFPGARQIGPGKIDLLECLDREGSISAAARAMDMSYRRAWLLLNELDGLFKKPIMSASTGGAHGGGAKLTDFGRSLVTAYRRIEDRAALAAREELAALGTGVKKL